MYIHHACSIVDINLDLIVRRLLSGISSTKVMQLGMCIMLKIFADLSFGYPWNEKWKHLKISLVFIIIFHFVVMYRDLERAAYLLVNVSETKILCC